MNNIFLGVSKRIRNESCRQLLTKIVFLKFEIHLSEESFSNNWNLLLNRKTEISLSRKLFLVCGKGSTHTEYLVCLSFKERRLYKGNIGNKRIKYLSFRLLIPCFPFQHHGEYEQAILYFLMFGKQHHPLVRDLCVALSPAFVDVAVQLARLTRAVVLRWAHISRTCNLAIGNTLCDLSVMNRIRGYDIAHTWAIASYRRERDDSWLWCKETLECRRESYVCEVENKFDFDFYCSWRFLFVTSIPLGVI